MTEAQEYAANNRDKFEEALIIMNKIIFDGMEWMSGDLEERIFLAMEKYKENQ